MERNCLLRKAFLLAIACSILNISGGLAWTTIPDAEYFPSGWRLNPGAHFKNPKFEIVKDSPGAWKGNKYVYVRGHLMSGMISVSGGDELEISFYARDAEQKDVSCLLYAYSGRKFVGSLKGFTQKAGTDWTRASGTIKIPATTDETRLEEKMVDKPYPIDMVVVVLAGNMETGAYFDYPEIAHVKTGEWAHPECARYEGRGSLKLSRRNYAGALEDFKNALKLAGSQKEKKLLASRVEETERMKKALATGEKGEGLFLQADIYEKEGRYREAIKEYERIKDQSDPENDYLREVALFNIAGLYRKDKDYTAAHRTYKEIFSLPGLTDYYRIYGLFRQAEVYTEQKEYAEARKLYGQIQKIDSTQEHHVFEARLYAADTYRLAGTYSRARNMYQTLLVEQNRSEFPHESYRRDIIDRLENIEGLEDGAEEKSVQQKRVEWLNKPEYAIYVSLQGDDNNPGTKKQPFATIERAQEEVRSIKKGKGMPEGGIAVYMRGGIYLVTDSVRFKKEDSGTESSPVVYRSFPGEEVRIIGGKKITRFHPLADPDILSRLPEESRDRVWVADLKEAGITEYGELVTRGFRRARPGAMELIFNTKIMQLSRWPNEGEWARVTGLTSIDKKSGAREWQLGKFLYSGDRPQRWTEEKDMWVKGYLAASYALAHFRIQSIDTKNRTITLQPDTLPGAYDAYVMKGAPYYVYNVLSEIDLPGEWYLERNTGKLYFYPPGDINTGEIIVTTLDRPVIKFDDTSNVVLFGLTLEGTWRHGIQMYGGRNNLVAGSTIRNTGQYAVRVESGWEHSVVGCDIYDTGEGGILLNGGDRKRLIPGRHTAENNHIHHFNRFCSGSGRQAVSVGGDRNDDAFLDPTPLPAVGLRVAHNLISDSVHKAIHFDYNDHVIEFNEIYDVVHEARDAGAIYVYGEPRFLMNRGNVLRYNFIHHITEMSSAVQYNNPGVNMIYIDALNAGMTIEGNIFYRCTGSAVFVHGADNCLENNIFVDNRTSLSIGDRSRLMKNPGIIYFRYREQFFRDVNYKQPPWSSRYPQITRVFEDTLPLGRTENNDIKRNVNTGGLFVSTSGFKEEKNSVGNNWDINKLMFVNKDKMDFRFRTGAPVYGVKGITPVPFEKIGVYEDPLRASWPVKEIPAGKYFK